MGMERAVENKNVDNKNVEDKNEESERRAEWEGAKQKERTDLIHLFFPQKSNALRSWVGLILV